MDKEKDIKKTYIIKENVSWRIIITAKTENPIPELEGSSKAQDISPFFDLWN